MACLLIFSKYNLKSKHFKLCCSIISWPFLIVHVFWYFVFKKSFHKLTLLKLLFSPRRFIVLTFTFRFIFHFEFCVYCEQRARFMFLSKANNCSRTICWKDYYSSIGLPWQLVKVNLPYVYLFQLFLLYSIYLFYVNITLYLQLTL